MYCEIFKVYVRNLNVLYMHRKKIFIHDIYLMLSIQYIYRKLNVWY